jgi:hypothetical protein
MQAYMHIPCSAVRLVWTGISLWNFISAEQEHHGIGLGVFLFCLRNGDTDKTHVEAGVHSIGLQSPVPRSICCRSGGLWRLDLYGENLVMEIPVTTYLLDALQVFVRSQVTWV